jgi:hypothetical protein
MCVAQCWLKHHCAALYVCECVYPYTYAARHTSMSLTDPLESQRHCSPLPWNTTVCTSFFFFFLEGVIMGFIRRQALYHLRHTQSFLLYFPERVSRFLLRAGLKLWSSYVAGILCLPNSWDIPPHLTCLLRWNLYNFVHKLASTMTLPLSIQCIF